MDPSDFRNSPSGYLVPTIFNQTAFVPHPLPPAVDLNKCMTELDRASRAMAELKGRSYNLVNPQHLINPLQRREAIASSSIEGTYTTASELLLFDQAHGRGIHDPDTQEVYNYISALQQGMDLLKTLPISSRLIKTLHATLLQGVKRHRGLEIVPGEFKRDQNFIGSRTRRLDEARFVPPPPDMTPHLMSQLETFINSDTARAMPPVLVNAFVHYQFETIHPFPDGNGRVGRLLLPLILAVQGVMTTPLLYISPYIEKHKDEYNDSMLEVSRVGAWEAWIRFFADVIERSAVDALRKVDAIAKLREEFLQKVQQARASGLLPALIDLVFDRLMISIPEAKNKLDVTYRSAQHNIDKLAALGIVTPIKFQTRPKLYVCDPLFKLVFETESPAAAVGDE